jgi:predicted naringenin-chalcone synthase
VWRIGNVGFDLLLSPEVPKIVRENIGPLMEGIYQRNGLTGKGADFYAIHPGGTKILEACEQALSLSAEQNEVSYGILRDFGNMSSVTILFVLQRYIAEKLTDSDKGKTLLACAFGPGITMEAMLVEII